MAVIHLNSNQVIADDVKTADDFWRRLKGLLGRKSIPDNFALHIIPCTSIHTFFMKFPIDVLHLNNHNKVTGIEENLKPGKVGKRFSHTRSIIELPAGKVAQSGIIVGDTVALVEGKLSKRAVE